MAVTFLVDGAPGDSLEFYASPIAETGALLHLMADPGHHTPFRDLGRRIREDLPPQLEAEFEALSPLWTGYRCRLLYPLKHGATPSIEDDLNQIAGLALDRASEAIIWAILGGHTGAPSVRPAPSVDIANQILDRARQRGHTALRLIEDHLSDPGGTRERLLGFLHAISEVVAPEWQRVNAPLAADAQLRRRIAARDGVTAALTGLTPASRLLSDPERVAFDKMHHGILDLRRKVLLALPSVFGWPHLLVKHEPGWPALVQYPIGPTVISREVPSATLVRRRLAVLSDSSRIQVCRLLAREQLSTTDLARLTGVSAPQMSRLLKPLRDAGLLTSERDGHFVRYRLDVEAISRLGSDLVVSLLR